MKLKNYVCQVCGCREFVTAPNRYDIMAEKGKLVFKNAEYVDEKLVLYCRECSEELSFDEIDIVI